jgi:hypothetical protein
MTDRSAAENANSPSLKDLMRKLSHFPTTYLSFRKCKVHF